MDEREFNDRADAMLAYIEQALDACGIDTESKPGGVLELEFDSGSKIIINRHSAAREIWLAAKSGGYHFGPDASNAMLWIASRDGAELLSVLQRCISEQAGIAIEFATAKR